MIKLTNNNSFSAYDGQYIQMIDNGVIRKYFVQTIDKDSIVAGAGRLKEGNYSVIGLSPKQTCELCDDICSNYIPYITIEWFQPAFSTPLLSFNERYEVFLNNTSLGILETSALDSLPYTPVRFGFRTFIPTELEGLTFNNEYYTIYNQTTYGGSSATNLSTIPNIFNINDYNELVIKPVYADNSFAESLDSFYEVDKFYTAFNASVQVAKIVNTTINTSAVSCISWNMYSGSDFASVFPGPDFRNSIFNHITKVFDGSSHIYNNSYTLSTGCITQTTSSVFLFLNPCEVPLGIGNYIIDPEFYYENDGVAPPPGYVNNGSQAGYDIIQNGPVIFKKMVFFTNIGKTSTLTLYFGRDSSNPYSSPSIVVYDVQLASNVSFPQSEGYFFGDYGFTKYNGTVIVNTLGNTAGFFKYHTRALTIVNGIPTLIQNAI